MQALPQLLEGPDRDDLEQAAADLAGKGVPAELAIRVAGLGMLFPALDIVEGASATGLPVETVAGVHFTLGTRLQLHWLRDQILALPLGDRWQSLARAALRDDLYALHSMLTTEVLQNGPPDLDAQGRIDAWVAQNGAPVERWLQVLSDIKSGETFDFVTLSVAVHGVPNLIHPSAQVPAGRPS
jgi:glutamate dehydrogenase